MNEINYVDYVTAKKMKLAGYQQDDSLFYWGQYPAGGVVICTDLNTDNRVNAKAKMWLWLKRRGLV